MFYLVGLVTNTQGQHSQTVNPYENADLAKTNYHTKLAAFHNASDVLYAVVLILDEYGKELMGFREIVDKRPTPEPTPEPTEE